ncbi:hypothetical protein [Cryptosporangium aurantiacum]|uniref:TM2 domain-containing protein n=1 Tax=Cryptosporangium aurantiacum TaxID=134849 RepID=A0A1M7TU43_9ACTN|nr:hypothetical protein [Cryptosporangium aurantiacum]SHN74269.1 hypothetical protein SAMN05443668_10748 [Cryptosporangium aurantiacum]
MTLPLPGPHDRDPWYPADPASAPPHAGYPYSAPPNAGGVQPYSAQPYSAAPYSGQPYPGPHPPHYAPPVGYGVDPITGLPYSDKSKLVAGLLQMLPGFFLGLGGIGRLYAGHTALGAVQIGATLVGWVSFWLAVCLSFLLFPLLMFGVYGAMWLWFVIDGIVLLAGNPRDGQGRPLRT